MKNLTQTVFWGAVWQGLGRYSALLIQFAVNIVLARILDPSLFGTISLLNVFIAISSLFVDAGLGQSLIQKENPSQDDYSSVLYFNIFFSFNIYVILFFLLPYIANFYNDEALIKCGRLLFLCIPISSFCIVQNVMLTKKYNFKRLSLIQVISALSSGIIGIIAALLGCGVMSLVYHALALNFTKAFLLIIFNHWYPKMYFSWTSIRSLLPLGLSLLMTSLIKVIFNNIYTLIIGKQYSKQEVGFYNQAKRLEELSGNTILEVLISVSFPALVEKKSDNHALKLAYKRLFYSTSFFVVPLMTLLYFVGEELIVFIFTEKWINSVPYFRLLCIYGMTLPLHLLNDNILKVFGEGRTIVFIEIFRRLLLMISIVVTYKISIEAMLIGQIICIIPLIIVSMIVSGKYINYSFFEQVKDVLPFYIIAGIAAIISIISFKYFIIDCILFSLLSKIFFYFAIYFVLSLIFKIPIVSLFTSVFRKFK